MDRVKTLGLFFCDFKHFHADDTEPCILDSVQDIACSALPYRVGLIMLNVRCSVFMPSYF